MALPLLGFASAFRMNRKRVLPNISRSGRFGDVGVRRSTSRTSWRPRPDQARSNGCGRREMSAQRRDGQQSPAREHNKAVERMACRIVDSLQI